MKTRKALVSVVLIILIFFSFAKPVSVNFFTDDDDSSDIEKTIDKDEGGLFEKIIAKIIGGLAETVFDLSTKEEFGVGFKNYDELIFGNNQNDISPFSKELWQLIMRWYWIIAGLIGGPILIAIVIIAWKMIYAGISPDKRSEAKDSITRLFFGASAIGFAPIFVKLMLLLNNSLVRILVANAHGKLDDLLGNSILTNINTGNAIATAIVIAMFAYLFVKVNIKFIIREFTLIVFTIFTPIVAVFWIINKRTIAASIWFGQIIINSFMQFIYTFLFLIYMTFLPESSGWAVSLLWAIMILPLADALQNTMQNLVSRIAGVNNEEIANRGIGMAAAMGYTVKTIAYQFKGNNGENTKQTVSTAGKVANTITNIPSISYDNKSVNVMDNAKPIITANAIKNTSALEVNGTKQNQDQTRNGVNGIRKAINVGKEAMNLGKIIEIMRKAKVKVMKIE